MQKRYSKKKKQVKRTNPLICLGITGVLAAAGVCMYKYSMPPPEPVRSIYLAPLNQLSFDSVSSLEGIEKIVVQQGERPEVIIVLQEHPSMITRFGEIDPKNKTDCIYNIEYICDQLFANYGVQSAIFEGLDETLVNGYRQGGSLSLSLGQGSGYRAVFAAVMERTINSRRWNLYPGDKAELLDKIQAQEKPIVNINRRLEDEINETAKRLSKEILGKTGDKDLYLKKLKESFGQIITKYQKELDALLTKEWLDKLYDLEVLQRNASFVQGCLKARENMQTPIIMVIGYQHYPDLLAKFGDIGYGCIVLQPQGFSKPNHVKPSRGTFGDMFKHNYALPTVDEIKVDIVEKPN